MNNRNKTPLLRPLRKEGGTLYIFPSATEDIGLNINSRANRVALSYYALLDIPACKSFENVINDQEASEGDKKVNANIFMPGLIPGRFGSNMEADAADIKKSVGIGSWEIAASLQNYAMNFETVLRNQSTYNYQLSKTVSERVFWKWLKETGAIRWEYIIDHGEGTTGTDILKGYYREVSSDSEENSYYNRVVKCIGEIAAGNSTSTEFGMFNEIYITVPSSYGESPIYFQIDEDDNYKLGQGYTSQDLQAQLLEGRNDFAENDIVDYQYTVNRPWSDIYNLSDDPSGDSSIVTANGKPWYIDLYNTNVTGNMYITDDGITFPENLGAIDLDTSLYVKFSNEDATQDSSFVFKRSKLDAVSLVKDLTVYQHIMESQTGAGGEFYSDRYPKEIIDDNLLDWDKLAIDFHKNTTSTFTFNTVLLYYTVYDPHTQAELATNLFGVLFLDGLENNPESTTDYTGGSMEFSFNEIEKRQSNVNGFGTGYSFRVNIKTSSIFDNTDALISDNTTANSTLPDNFNDVIYSLHQSLSLMRGNTYITQTLVDQYNEMQTRLTNDEINISKLTNDLNTYLMFKYKDIISQSIDSEVVAVRTITPVSMKTAKSEGSLNYPHSIDFNYYMQDPDNSENWILSPDGPLMSIDYNKVSIKKAQTDTLETGNVFQKIEGLTSTEINKEDVSSNFSVAYEIIEALGIKRLSRNDGEDIQYVIDPSSALFVSPEKKMYKENMSYLDETTADIAWVNYQKLLPVVIMALKHLKSLHNTVSMTEKKTGERLARIGREALDYARNNVDLELESVRAEVSEKIGELKNYEDIINSSHEEIVQAVTTNVIEQAGDGEGDIVNTVVKSIDSSVIEQITKNAINEINGQLYSSASDYSIQKMVNEKVTEAAKKVIREMDIKPKTSAEDIQVIESAGSESVNLNTVLAALSYRLDMLSGYLSQSTSNQANTSTYDDYVNAQVSNNENLVTFNNSINGITANLVSQQIEGYTGISAPTVHNDIPQELP